MMLMTTTTTTIMTTVASCVSLPSALRFSSSRSPPRLSSTRFRCKDLRRKWTLLPIKCMSSSRRLSSTRFRCKDLRRKWTLLPIKCMSSSDNDDDSYHPKAVSFSSSSTYKWCAALGGVGLLETSYLTYLKISGSDAFCPIGGGTCDGVLNSDYAAVFGVPLPLIGTIMYGLVTTLGLQLGGKNLPSSINVTYGRFLLLGSTTAMASASAYFLYILNTKLSGASCLYCLVSALLSFSLFFLTLKDVKFQEIQKSLALQICLASVVIATLTASYSTAQPVSSSSGEIELPYFITEITSPSRPSAVALARHLNSIGAKMYGAFWCSHCLEQKQMFGREAAKLLDYVECFPDGYRKGTKIAKACADARIQGFPTWVINGQIISGERELTELAEASGFSLNDAPEFK